MAKILETDGMAKEGIAMLTAAGHTVDSKKLKPEELVKVIGQYDALVVRSSAQVTAEVLKAGAPKLKVVGRAGVGVDNVDVKAATQHGIVVLNAPLGNVLSAAEHTIGMIFAAARAIPQAHAKLMAGTWDKKTFVGVELIGKTLGIIGLGKIGRHVAKVMQAAGMTVLTYDPFVTKEAAAEIGVEAVDLEALITRADFITLHVPKTDKTANMINAAAIAKMKPGVRIINVARGGVVNEADLLAALDAGKIAAAALDVFATEPLPADSPFLGYKKPNLIVTPHLGASTEEAQTRVSTDVAEAFNAFFAKGEIRNAVNVKLTLDPAIAGYLKAAELLGEAVAQSVDAPITGLELRVTGDLAKADVKPLSLAALKGLLGRTTDDPVNLVNATLVAEQRGITVATSKVEQPKDGAAKLTITATTQNGTRSIGGSLVEGQLRVLQIDDYRIDLPLGGTVLVMEYPDRPGMVGRYGTILGENRINIARMEVSRIDGRGDALVLLTLDDPVPEPVLTSIKAAIQPKRCYTLTVG